MGKNLLKTICLATAGLLLPSFAFAAGLGRLTVQSALGEPLRAEIEVVSVQPDEADTLAAGLASQAAFRQANIDLNSALFEVRFALERRPGGRHVILMTSNKPINEPFLDMLVELNWAGGRLIREYTFLLDPPEYRGPAVAAPTLPVTPPAVKPLAAVPVPAPARAPEVGVPAQPAPAPAPVAAAPAAPRTPAKTYEVKRGDTLGRIAQSNLPPGVSLQQMLVALYRNNEDAFIGSNMNRLRAGRILNIPEDETALAIAQGDARGVVAAQSADYAEYRRSIGAAVAATAERPEGSRQAAGRIESATPDKAPAAAAPTRDQLRLSKPDEKGPAKAGPAAKADDAVAQNKSLREAQERIAMLEKNIADMKKLQGLKSAPGAQLQQQAEAAKGTKGEPLKAAPAPVPPPAPAAKADTATAGAKAPAPAVTADAGKAPAAAKEEPSKDAPKAESGKAAAPAVITDAAKAPALPEAAKGPSDAPIAADASKAAPKAPAKAAPAPPPPATLLDELVDNIYALMGMVVVLILLIAYAFYAWRKKKEASRQRFESSVMPSLPAEPSSVVGMAGGQKVDTGSAALTDFSEGGAKADADEIDPVAEADVYMAYGRDAQAEEILKEALAKDPQRHPVRLKLLEVYANRKDARSFEAQAKELHASTAGHGPEWDKAIALGRQLDPANPLYGGSGVTAATAAAAAAGMAAGAAMEAAASEPATAPALDFDLDVGAAPGAQPDIDRDTVAPAVPAALEQTTTIDFDLDLGGDQAAGEKTAEIAPDTATASAPAADSGSSIDFDLGLGAEQSAAPEPAAEKPAEAAAVEAGGGNAMDFDLTLDDDAPPAPEKATGASPPSPSADFDLSAISLDLGSDSTAPAPGIDAKWQEVATKLDLAKAYEEMGDKDGARDLLNEVVREGDGAQQQQAKTMLEALS